MKGDLLDDFLSDANFAVICSRIRRLREENNYFPQVSIRAAIHHWLRFNDPKKWSIKCPYDIGASTKFMNEKFIKDNYKLYKKNMVGNLNVFNTEVLVQNGNRMVRKKYADFGVEDIRNIDVWRPIAIGISDQQQRYNNKIPSWQRTMNIRNMDMSPEVFNVNLADRDALEQVPSGYNMSRIRRMSYYRQ